MAPPRKLLEQYENEAYRVPNGCLIHTSHFAARKTFFMRHPEADKKLYVCHKCDDRFCIEDAHLFLGTCGDNIRDAVAKGRHSCFANIGKAHDGVVRAWNDPTHRLNTRNFNADN